MDAHEAAVKSALRTGDEVNRLIARLGTADHPRGEVLGAYRNVQRGVRAALDFGPGFQRDMALQDALGGLRNAVRQTTRATLSAAVAVGQEQAERQAAAWGLSFDSGLRPSAQDDITRPMEAAWLTTVEGQATAALALAATGADEAEIVGDESRAGVLRPAPVVAEGARWVAGAVTAAMVAWWDLVLRDRGGERRREGWMHQAVAAIDERTTDCCLRVHGQVQPLDKPFRLTGTPRYADEQEHPPFHWYCRSAEALVAARFAEDTLTQEMVDAARAELRARGPDGKQRVEIHPAHARSRR